MKKQIRVLGIDDCPFDRFNHKTVRVIATLFRGGDYIDGVLSTKVRIDGKNSTLRLIELINNCKFKKTLHAVLLDGIALGGFNVVDIEKLYNETKIPIITITRDEPDFDKIKKALEKNFSDWKNRWELLSKGELHKVKTKHNPIFVKCVGLSIDEAKEIIKLSTIRGVIPEPIRVAHLVASGITRGESYGKA